MCVINATATATEVLKNIVLPGVGHFTIVDGHKISGEDVGNNFFLDIGKQITKILLQITVSQNWLRTLLILLFIGYRASWTESRFRGYNSVVRTEP